MTTGSKQRAGPKRYIEIVNWGKAQPRMAEGQNFWCKLYTDLLDNDGYHEMDNASRVLVTSIWMYAARTGRHVFPADPKWLHKRIPMLHEEPDFGPLIRAKDIYGHAMPFLRYCDAPASRNGEDGEFEAQAAQGRGRDTPGTGRKSGAGKGALAKPPKEKPPAKKPKSKHTTEQKREERREKREERREQREETKPYRVSERQKKRKTLSGFAQEETDSKAEHGSREQTAAQVQQTSAEPENPKISEAGEARGHHVPLPPRSVRAAGPQIIGQVIAQRFPDHWQDPDAEAFGWQIVEALGMARDVHNLAVRSEWGAFAAWWSAVKRAAPPMLHRELWSMAVGKAVWIRAGPKGPKNVRNPGALWRDIMDKEMVHRGLIVPPARASPLHHAES